MIENMNLEDIDKYLLSRNKKSNLDMPKDLVDRIMDGEIIDDTFVKSAILSYEVINWEEVNLDKETQIQLSKYALFPAFSNSSRSMYRVYSPEDGRFLLEYGVN